MSVRTIGNRQNVNGNTMAVDLTTTIRIAVTGGLTTTVFVDSTTGFPATGTIFFPGGYSFTYTGINTGVGSGERFSGASQSLPSVAVDALVTSNNSATLTNPINSFRGTDIITGTEEYIFTETGTASAEGPINFPAGSSIVIGTPVIDPTINLESGTTTTNLNAPYTFNNVTNWNSAATINSLAAGKAATVTFAFSSNSGSQILGIQGNDAFATETSNSDAWVVATTGTPTSNQLIWVGRFNDAVDTTPVSLSTTEIQVRCGPSSLSIPDWLDNGVDGWNAMSTDSSSPTVVNARDTTTQTFQAYRNFTASRDGNNTVWTYNEAKVLSVPTNFILGSGTVTFVNGNTTDRVFTITGTATGLKVGDGVGTSSAGANETTIATLSTATGNTVFTLTDSTGWTGTSEVFLKSITTSWDLNSSSIVPLDAETGFPGIAARLKFRFQNPYSSVGDNQWTLVNSDDTTAAPVFYGVDFNADEGVLQLGVTTGGMNFVGAANSSFNSPTGQGIPQFHDCTWTVNANQADVRWLGPNPLINGFTFTSYGTTSSRFEFGTAPIFTPRGVKLNMPNIGDLKPRAFLFFCQGGGGPMGLKPENNAANTYVFENPTAPNIALFNGNPGSTINNDPNVGLVAINPVDAALIPYATTIAGIATTTDFANLIMPSSDDGSEFWGRRLSNSTIMIGQRIKINFPSTGWTTRVVKTASATYTRDQSLSANSRDILWQSRIRKSLGGLVRDTTNVFNTTAEFFPTSGAAPTATVDGTTTPGSGGGIQNLRVLETALNENRLATNDVPVYYGIDTTTSGSSIDLIVPAYTVFPNTAGDNLPNNTIYFNSYKIICQNDQYGTQVFNYGFDPAGSNYPTGYQNPTWGDIVETVPATLIDTAYTDSITDLDTSPIESLQDIYNSLKIFERLRTANADYTASHRTSDTTFLTRTGKSFTTSFADIGITSIGRSVKTSGTTVNLKLASNWTNGNTDNVDQLVASGKIELELFPDLTGINLKATSFTNLPNAIPAVANLEGTYTKSDSTAETFTFTNSNVSNLHLVNSNTGVKNTIRGTSADGTAIQPGDFASVTPSGAGVAGEWLFPLERKIEITLETTNTERTFRATYKGVDVTSEVTKDTTTVTGSTIYKYTGDGEGSFVIGVWVDGFNYAVVNTTALTAAFNLVSIPSEFLDFTTSLGELSTAVISSATPAFASGVYTISLLKATIDTKLDNHSAILGSEARLLTRRLLEKNNSSIAFLQSLSDDGKSRTFFTYDPAGWAIDIPAKSSADEIVQIVYSAEEAKDLVINVFPKDALGNAIWDRIVSDTPSLSPIFPPQGFTIITQSEESVQAFGKVVADEVSPAFKKTSRLIPVNDSDFPNI